MGKKKASGQGDQAAKKSKSSPEMQPEPDFHVTNKIYFEQLMTAQSVITDKWPNIASVDALPMGEGGYGGLEGFSAPYTAEAYDAQYQPGMEYACGFNFMSHNLLRCALPYVPIVSERVWELVEALQPGLSKNSLVLHAAHSKGSKIAAADLVRYSPDEHAHAVIFKVAKRLGDPALSEKEADDWLRMLLSYPVVFKRLDTKDAKFAEANSGRFDYANAARASSHTARQTCYNINGFNKQRGGDMSATQIHDFFHSSIRLGAQSENYKKTTFDCAQTVYKRLLSIPDAELAVAANESTGPKACWNNLYNLQEVIYRCSTPKQIVWLLQSVGDSIACEKLSNEDITCRSLKSGGRSTSDPIMMQLQIRDFCLGSWLDNMGFDADVKERVRTIFKAHDTFRSMYCPVDGQALDNGWVFRLSKAAQTLLSFLEGAIYCPTAAEECLLRQAIKNGNTVQDVLSWKPWCEKVNIMKQQLLTSEDAKIKVTPHTTFFFQKKM